MERGGDEHPLSPEVAAGIIEPRRIAVSMATALPRIRLVLGEATSVDVEQRAVTYDDAEGGIARLPYDRLVLAVGSINTSPAGTRPLCPTRPGETTDMTASTLSVKAGSPGTTCPPHSGTASASRTATTISGSSSTWPG